MNTRATPHLPIITKTRILMHIRSACFPTSEPMPQPKSNDVQELRRSCQTTPRNYSKTSKMKTANASGFVNRSYGRKESEVQQVNYKLIGLTNFRKHCTLCSTREFTHESFVLRFKLSDCTAGERRFYHFLITSYSRMHRTLLRNDQPYRELPSTNPGST